MFLVLGPVQITILKWLNSEFQFFCPNTIYDILYDFFLWLFEHKNRMFFILDLIYFYMRS